MNYEPPEFVAAKLVAELAGWDVSEGHNTHAFDRYYVATWLRTCEWWKVEPTPAGAQKLVGLVKRANAVAA